MSRWSVEAILKHWPSTAFTQHCFYQHWSWWFIWLTDLSVSWPVTRLQHSFLYLSQPGHALHTVYCFKYYHQGSQRHREWLFLGTSPWHCRGTPTLCFLSVHGLAGCVLRARASGLQKMWQVWASSESSCQTLLAACSQCAKAHLSLIGSLAPQSLDLFLAKWFIRCLCVRIWGSMVHGFDLAFLFYQGLSWPQPCCLVHGLMASHWIYDLQPTGPIQNRILEVGWVAVYPDEEDDDQLPCNGKWCDGSHCQLCMEDVVCHWLELMIACIDLMGRYLTISPLWGKSFFCSQAAESLPTG